MTKKNNAPMPGDFDYAGPNPGETPDGTGAALNMDFNLDTEAKEDPMIPPGTYFANVTKVWYDPERYSITWKLVLDGNEGVMSDGETPVDGATVLNNNWLPKPGDEDTPTANGRGTKRQSKINMLKKFADLMGIDMSTPTAIQEALANHEWIGIQCQITVGLREYNGQTFNEVKSMRANA